MFRHIALLSIGLLGLPQAARAMQFINYPSSDGRVTIAATGPIVPGDFGRLLSALTLAGSAAGVVVALDSPGGNLAEAEKLANYVRTLHPVVTVGSRATCASACFVVFAAGAQKFAADAALIGVHSASVGGRETADAMSATIGVARAAASFGVPDAIIGKLVSTLPGRIEWLTPDDLAAMGVRRLPDAPAPVIVHGGVSDPCSALRPSLAAPPGPMVFTAGCTTARIASGAP